MALIEPEINDELLEDLFSWVDSVPLSRPKKDIRRDFSDGVMVAEVIKYYFPNAIELHNYNSANRIDRKITNWNLLNRKIFKKLLGFELADDTIKNVTSCQAGAVEQVLMFLRRKIDRVLFESNRTLHERGDHETGPENEQPEADQSKYTIMQQHIPPSVTRPTTIKSPEITSKVKHQRPHVVTKLEIEEKEQDLLVKDETIQILQAKIRRLEHLMHLKDIRIDDLQERITDVEAQLRPTAHPKEKALKSQIKSHTSN